MLIAHRGFRTKQGENRIIDFIQALKVTKAVEFDIRLTKDQKVIIFHDDDFKRIGQNQAKVRTLTYEEIKNLPFFQQHQDSIPPLLIEDFTQHLANQYQLINVEIKADVYSDQDFKIFKQSLEILRNSSTAEIIVSSFDQQVNQWIATLPLTLKKGYLLNKIKLIDFNLIKKFDYIHPAIKLVKRHSYLKIFQELNLPLNLWTFKKNHEVESLKTNPLFSLITGYISDNPDLKIA